MSRKLQVTFVLGVGGEPSAPELLYVIPLNRISAILSKKVPIIDFLYSSHTLDVSMFLPTVEMGYARTYTIEEKIKVHANAYKPWSKDGDNQLIALYNEGKSINDLSTFFKRNKGAICSRLKKILGRREIKLL